MDTKISDKKYPVQSIWYFKYAFPMIVSLPIFIGVYFGKKQDMDVKSVPVFVMFLFVSAFVILIQSLFNYLRVKYFHFVIDENYMIFNQGVFKKESRNTPYGRIQGVYLNQSLFDRIFGLSSLTIEDFSVGGFSKMDTKGNIGRGRGRYEAVGFEGCRIHIPGIKKGDAEELKTMLLKKIVDNPIHDMHSGL